jgi:hypothetical protein
MQSSNNITPDERKVLHALSGSGGMLNSDLAKYRRWTLAKTARITRRMADQGKIIWGDKGWERAEQNGTQGREPAKKTDSIASPQELAKMPALRDDEAAVCAAADIADGIADDTAGSDEEGNGVTASGRVTLLQEAETFLSDRVHFQEDVSYPLVLTLYAAMTHCHQPCGFVLPYIGVRANTDSAGKSRLMELIGSLCLRPSPLLTNPSGASLLRRITRDHPTLLVDESEELQKPNSNTREIFNSGYKPGGVVTRAQGPGEIVYRVYCPKIYGMIGDPDHPLRARSIMVLLEKGDIRVDDKAQIFAPVGAAIALRLAVMVNQHVHDIESTYLGYANALKAVLPVQRDREIWEALFAICTHLAPERMEELTNAAQAISTLKTRPAKLYVELKQAMADSVTYQYAEQLARDSFSITKASGERNIHTHTLITELVKSPMWKFFENHNAVKIGDPDGHYVLATMLQMIAGNDACPKPVKVKNHLLRGYTLDWLEQATQRTK